MGCTIILTVFQTSSYLVWILFPNLSVENLLPKPKRGGGERKLDAHVAVLKRDPEDGCGDTRP